MWQRRDYADFEKRLKKLRKRHRQESLNALDNLDEYLESLRSELSPQQIVHGWVHREPRGLKALDQSGPKNPQKEIRLYVYPDEDDKVLHVLTIGDKDSQQGDIRHCEEFVEQLLRDKAKSEQGQQTAAEQGKEARDNEKPDEQTAE